MKLVDRVTRDVSGILRSRWKMRNGRGIPTTDDIPLIGGGMTLNATFLYADMAESSRFAQELDARVVAKILKGFLTVSSRLIAAGKGRVIKFDGDRVLGMFHGNSKETRAALCGFQINWAVKNIIRKKFESSYALEGRGFRIRHAVGIDSSDVLVVRTGLRRSRHDLVSVGRSPNMAAMLSELREQPYRTFVSSRVYENLEEKARNGGNGRADVWEERPWYYLGKAKVVYQSQCKWWPT